MHTANVALVRNLSTGYISPQCYVVFDNWFKTVSIDDESKNTNWDLKFTWEIDFDGQHHKIIIDDEDGEIFELDDKWLTKDKILPKKSQISYWKETELQHIQRLTSSNSQSITN